MENRRVIVQQRNDIPFPLPEKAPNTFKDDVLGDISLDKIGDNMLQILNRQVKRLMGASAERMLTKDEDSTLQTCFKLWVDMKKREKELLEGLDTEELKSMLGETNEVV
jgi:hypothetical protein